MKAGWRGRREGLFAQRDFARMWLAQIVSSLGSRVTRTALPIMAVLSIRSSPLGLALLAVLATVPGVLVALVSGGWIDRSRKRPILVGADLARAAAVVSVPIAAWTGALTLPHLLVVGAVVGGGTVLFQIAAHAYLPSLVGTPHVVAANSVVEATESVAEVAGPGMGGALIQALTAPIAVLLDAVSYLVSAGLLRRIARPEVPAAAADRSSSMRGDLATGLRVSWSHPIVRGLLLAQTTSSFFSGTFASLYVLFALDLLHLTPATLGVVISMGGIGSLFGAIGSRRLVERFGLGRALIGALAVSQAAGLFIPAARGPVWVALACLFSHQLIGDAFMVAFAVQSVSLRQTILPLEVLGRCNAAFQAIVWTAAPLGALGAGGLAMALGIRPAMWIGLGLGLLAPLWLLPLWRVVRAPSGAGEPGAPAARLSASG